MMGFLLVCWAVAVLGTVGVGVLLMLRCWRKRQERENIKRAMMHRRSQFAASMGMNVFQLNADVTRNYTMHV